MHEAIQVFCFLNSIRTCDPSCLFQVTLIANQDKESIFVLFHHLFMPVIDLVERKLAVNGIDKDANVYIPYEEGNEILHLTISCSIPYFEDNVLCSAIIFLYSHTLVDVLAYSCWLCLMFLCFLFHEGFYYRRLADIAISKKQYLRLIATVFVLLLYDFFSFFFSFFAAIHHLFQYVSHYVQLFLISFTIN